MIATLLCIAAIPQSPAAPIHSVTDIAHDFSFYMDGRFAGQYVDGGSHARNWGTLHKLDLSNANLLILHSTASPCRYTIKDLNSVREYLAKGGGLVATGDYSRFRTEREYHLNEVADAFGAEFLDVAAETPLVPAADLKAQEVKFYGGKVLKLRSPRSWTVLVSDAKGRPVAARRSWGKGQILLMSAGLHGRNPDASDPINAAWLKPLIRDLTKNKAVNSAKGVEGQWLDNSADRGGLRVRYSDYMAGWADSVFAIYEKERPIMEKVLGVPPSPNMMTSLILLPTGGGGFSDGTNIALGVWWGDFPAKQYGMVELLGHEGTHSWVLPFPEPMWNEGLATYVGILVGQEMGLKEDADATLKGWIEGAKKSDPNMDKMDLATGQGVPHSVAMAKPMWIFEQLRKDTPDVVARYFKAKRRLIDPAKFTRYSPDDSVAVLSVAVGRDLFPWFKSLGITVDRSKTKVPMAF